MAGTTGLSIDLDALIRRWKPDRQIAQLRARPAAQLVSAALAAGWRAFVLDTTVYVHNLAGTLDPAVADLLDRALLWHSAVCLGEITVGIGNYSPAAPEWRVMKAGYAELLRAIPASRILTPDDGVWRSAGIIAGTLARIQGFGRAQRKEMLNDVLIYLSATKAGLPVLTANREDFDLIQQVAGSGVFVYYDA